MKKNIYILKRITTIITIIALTAWTLVGQSPYNSVQEGPLAPTVAAMSYSKYADTPVNPVNGTTAIQIPLYQVSEGSLSHGVSLSYHTGGLRVSELASEVGMGWHLNAGGVISRTVRGIPDDEENKGYYDKGDEIYNSSTSEWDDVYDGDLDAQPDIFFYNVGGMTGKFMLDENQQFIQMPRSDVKIELNLGTEWYHIYRFLGFKLTAPDGTKYYFGEYSGGGTPAGQLTEIDGGKKHIDTWFLTRIESFDGKHQINFTYEENNYKYKFNQECYVTKYWDSGQEEAENTCDGNTLEIKVEGKILSTISTSTDTITFTTATRNDLLSNGGSPQRISEIQFETGDFCTKFELTHGYFEETPVDNNLYRRLRLEQVQKISCAYGSNDEEEPWVFTYNGSFFPHLLSRAQDHWGYYNGASTNNNYDYSIPYTQVTDEFDNTLSFGTNARYTVENEMKKGMLTKVTYPTKGYTEYEYEANRYMDDVDLPYSLLFNLETCDYGANCCDNQSDEETETITGEILFTGKISLTIFVDDANWPCYSGDHTTQVSIYNMSSGGGYVDGFSTNIPGIGTHTITKDLSDFNLSAGNDYKFVLSSHDAKGSLDVVYIPSVDNVLCGGLRLKQIKTHDGISSTNDIIRTFEYTMEGSSISSGRITNKPRYGYLVNDWTALFTSTGLLPLSNAHGSHITYTRMKEVYDGNGYTEYKLDNSGFSYSPSYPPKPIKFDALDGILKEQNIYDENDVLVSATEIEEGSSLSLDIQGMKYNLAKVKVYNGSSVGNKTLVTQILERTNIYRPDNTTQISDGISNTVFYEYHDQNSILSPVKVSTTNSDGKTTDVYTRYTVDYDLNSDIKDGLIERHMVGIPYETTSEVNGTQLNGSRTQYAYFTSSGYYTSSISTSNFPRPYFNQLYERTWTNGSLTSGVWIATDSLLQYTSDGLLSTYKKSNWPSVEYNYNSNKLITSIEYEDHTKSYIYYTNTGVLYKSIDIDDTDKIYTYDGLMRTKSIIDICKGTSTHYEYYFGPYSYERSYIKTTSTFPDTIPSLSELTSLEDYAYLDGLGRTVQTVRKGQAPNGHDIVQAVAYDNRGRAHKQYETQSNNGSGSYHAPQGGWEFALTEYEPSPLSRVVKVTPLGDMGPVEYSYGHNTTDDEVLVLPSPFIWPDNKLFKRTVKDGNGNLSISFTDLKGRVLMTRRTDSLESTAKNLDTYTLYDDKDRVSKVLPPGSETTTTDLIYEYEYNSRDQLVKKYIPGAEITEYMYNDRYQLGGYRDGYLMDQGKWYTYTYDDYGRDLLSGLYNGTPGSNFTPTETLTEMIYGTTGIERGKVKTSKSKILGTSTWLESTYHYTSCGRLDSVSGNNHINTSSGSTTTAHTYDGAGNIVRSQTSINAFGNTTTMQHTETIDHAGRPISEYIKINGGADRMIGQSVYNYKDQLITRYQGKTGLGGSVDWLQKTDYTYRLDGLLSKINDNNLTGGVQPITWCSLPQEHTPSSGSSYDERDLFYSILHYDEEVSGSSAPKQYNSNIAHVEWQVKGRRKQMYGYTYDEYNRLTEAEYYDRNSGDNDWDASGIYDGEYTYDERGNIMTLKRKGRMTGDSCYVTGVIDDLEYEYLSNSNCLNKVTESASVAWGFKNPTSNTTPYEYDDNGSMTEDHYKGVVTVYNHLTLPVYIAKGTDSILMMYDAGGSLLRKQHKSGSTVVMTRDYIGGIEYVNDTLDAIYHSEGRIKYIDEVGRYEYYIRDHLGNIRLTYSDLNADGLITTPDEILEEMHYYPFGMMMEGSWMGDAGQYGYNGIEYENFLDLEMNLATYRGLDPALGRWWQVDPKAEATFPLTPYGSMNNNPISFTDPDGDIAWIAPLAMAMLKGAAIGVATNGIINITNQQNFFHGAGNAALWGAVGGGIAHGIGVGAQAMANAGASKVQVGLAQAGAHGLSGGIQSWAQGGNFGSGFLSGGVSSGIGSLSSGWSSEAQMLSGIAGGGLASVAGGGNFWDGVKMGAITVGLNHLEHSLFTDPKSPPIDPKTGKPYLPGFRDAEYIGRKGKGWLKRHTWKDANGRILQWDSKKGEVEVYDKRGRNHKGGYDPYDRTRQISKPITSRIASGFRNLGPFALPISTTTFEVWLNSTLGYKPDNSNYH